MGYPRCIGAVGVFRLRSQGPAVQGAEGGKEVGMEERYVYQIVDRETGLVEGVYSRAYHDEVDFGSPEQARMANIHGVHQDKVRYRIQKVKVTREIVDENVD